VGKLSSSLPLLSSLFLFPSLHHHSKILVLDAISGKISRIVDSNHDRGIHCIALPQPSVHVSLPQGHYNLFATSSTDNVISLWDVRAPSIIFRFTDHLNRREKVQCAFSPCLRYLATGSEDRTVRIIDIQSGGRQIHKLNGFHRDVVTSVAYHPIHPQLISGSYDGAIRCFTANDQDA
jgi:WD40 repeat protein